MGIIYRVRLTSPLLHNTNITSKMQNENAKCKMKSPSQAANDATRCIDKTLSTLQDLHNSVIITSTPLLKPDWSIISDYSLTSSIVLINRLHFIWTSVEHTKVSLAINYNPHMQECGYSYKGHDFGWGREPGLASMNHQDWYSVVNRDHRLEEQDALGTTGWYQQLINLSTRIRQTIINFRNTMSRIFGPLTC